ncbi:MAG: hypothetical protein DMF72_09635 [Acidobacteria bacterium]|nr:MAG: hypothetical protein DMF72_09635 [Acidobacteriota bacterium]
MAASPIDPIKLMIHIIKTHAPENIWLESPLQGYRGLGNTNRGEIGEEFIRQYLKAAGLEISNGKRTSITDVKIGGHPFEIKTASLGANGTFQFNHVRLDRNYEYLLCLGICPQEIVYNMWRKGDVAEGKAGKLVRMAEGQAVTWKLTKQLSTMIPIEDLPDNLRITLDLPKLT